MLIVERLRIIREAMNLSVEEVELRSGLARSYLCDVENGQIVPSVAVLEKIATALEVPLAKLFYDGDGVPRCQIFRVGKPPMTSPVHRLPGD